MHGVPVWLETDVECEFKIEFKSGPLPVFAANVAVRRNAVKVVGFSDGYIVDC
ncbi:DNA topoisomerase III [Marinobacter psychrophilus]|uniref:DNA topoisomerase III n=1 Tax=Marinobacter psychrophilus TaxID=330734 RepID=A0A0H4HZE7_9GAMM|nr:DNA topoisomerase III [Marinobacter psychrophilus]